MLENANTWKIYAVSADSAEVPVADEVPPDQGLQLLNSHVLGVDAVIEQLTLHPGLHALTAGVVMTAASVAVHALADAVLFQCGPIGPAGVLGAPVRVDDGSPQGRIGRRRTVQRPHTQLRPHAVIHGQTEDSEIKAVKDG